MSTAATLESASLCAEVARNQTTLRDRYVRQAREEGATLAQIAAAVGLTGPGVRRILARSEPDHG